VKETLAEAQVARSKTAEIRAANEKLADELIGMLGLDSASDSKIQAQLKDLGVSVKTTGLIPRTQSFIQGLGETKELFGDAFAPNAPLDLARGGKAKRYSTPAGIVVAAVIKAETADGSKLESERSKLLEQLMEQKQRSLFSMWLKNVKDKAQIEKNPDVVNPGEQEKEAG
jgi:hypothetical protein